MKAGLPALAPTNHCRFRIDGNNVDR